MRSRWDEAVVTGTYPFQRSLGRRRLVASHLQSFYPPHLRFGQPMPQILVLKGTAVLHSSSRVRERAQKAAYKKRLYRTMKVLKQALNLHTHESNEHVLEHTISYLTSQIQPWLTDRSSHSRQP